MFTDSWFSIWVGHFDLFVDLFFFMSAFLLALLYYAELQIRFINPFTVYFLRLCRLLPAYAVIIFYYANLLGRVGDGPLWNIFIAEEEGNCRTHWWANFLFINNYFGADHMCVPHAWYLTCDFQMFVVGTMLVFLVHQKFYLGMVMIMVVFLASTMAAFLGTYLYNRPAMLLFFKDFWANVRQHDVFTTIYSQGHYRGTSYIMGLVAGIYVYRHKAEPLTKGWTYLTQGMGFLCCLMVYWSGSLFYKFSRSSNLLISSLYASTFHTAYGFGVALFTVSCCLGKPTPISKLFSWKGFIPLSKLSYCVFLVHFSIQFIWLGTSRTVIYLTPLTVISWTIADVTLSTISALILNLTIETPARYLVKYLISGAPAPKLKPGSHPEQREAYFIHSETSKN